MFLSLEDEKGIANVIVYPDLYQRQREVLVRHSFLMVDGVVQNVENVIHVRAIQLTPLLQEVATASHDFR